MNVEIRYKQFENDACLKRAQECMEYAKRFVPPWIIRINVYCGEVEDRGCIAEVTSNAEYLEFWVTLTPKFFGLTESEQLEIVKHEMLDGALLWIMSKMNDYTDAFVPAEIRKVLNSELTGRKEMVTEYLVRLLK